MKLLNYVAIVCLLLVSVIGCQDKTPDTVPSSAVTAPVMQADSEKGRQLAKNCEQCHGEKGEKFSLTVPYLAGQHTAYLTTALQSYQDGDRKNQRKRKLLKVLNNQDFLDMSAYYAQQQANWAGVRVEETKIQLGSVERGQAASTPCVDCHGLDGNSQIADVPSLAGLAHDYLIAAFDNYFAERRSGTIMKHFKHAVDWQELNDLAAYYSRLPRKKPPFKSPGNAKRGETLSKRCAGCHGIKGSTLLSDMPDLAKQNPIYLVNAIRAYQTGKRQHSLMKAAVSGLKDRDIKDLASYYAALSSTTEVTQSRVSAFDPIEQGRQLSINCQGCHGNNGNSEIPGTPSLSGLTTEYFLAALQNYVQGDRKHRMMLAFATGLNASQAEKLALYYSTQERKTKAKPAPKPEVKLLAECNGCHGGEGNSEKATVPSIAEQDSQYIINALRAYKKGSRHHEDMNNATKELTDAQIIALASYYAQIDLKPLPPRSLTGPKDLAAKCDRCHGERGFSQIPDNPRLAGQSETYLKTSLLAYKRGDRSHDTMFAMAEILTLSEIEAIAHYYAKQNTSKQGDPEQKK